MSEETKGDVQAALEAGRLLAGMNSVDGHYFQLIPEGMKLADLEAFQNKPMRIRETIFLTDKDSFLGYVSRWQESETFLFAQQKERKIQAVLDYHTDNKSPSWATHNVVLTLQASRQWVNWNQVSGKVIPQEAFAEFLEDNLEDIVTPDAADVLEVTKHLEAKKTVNFVSGVNLTNGSVQLNYEESIESKGKGQLTMPSQLTLQIPIFEGEEPQKVLVRLRYKIKETLTFTPQIIGVEQVEKEAWDRIKEEIRKEIDRPIFSGHRGK